MNVHFPFELHRSPSGTSVRGMGKFPFGLGHDQEGAGGAHAGTEAAVWQDFVVLLKYGVLPLHFLNESAPVVSEQER